MGSVKSNRLAVSAFVAAVLGALVAAFAPLGQTCSSTATVPALSPGSPAPTVAEVCHAVSTFSVDGVWVLVVVSVPVLVAFLPVLVRRRQARIASAVLLWIGCALGMLSVGIFFVPAAILMTIAAAQRPPVVAPPMPPIPAV
jgi:hypothetical protein